MPYANLSTGHRVHYFDSKLSEPERGNGRPPVVMVHGLGSSQNYYMPVIPHLKDFRCIAFDSYGAGRSRSRGESLTIENLAQDVVALMDHLSIPKAILAGHSMGGPVVLVAAAANPDRTLGVVAIGPVTPTAIPKQVFQQRIETATNEGMEPLANAISSSAPGPASTSLQCAIIRELLLGQDPAGYVSHCRAILNMSEPQGGFEAVKVPVLIIAGDEDKSAPLEGCQYIRDHLGSSRKELKVLETVGHWHCVEAPEKVAREISKFAASL